ncbi:ABC transporter substrate-binding protein [Tianweitania populi]|uniref:Peptide ABC transporter substrate-binding protein n=1 Tax=Tianweitania populi TaxID=1607949 RepID=A0A8J3DLV6_9HYPH|nr:ABC transporter substrate-binding protein [Tianweitania populi]GHD05224.1 peptide ABC transporter substrate-binding protein [Tianweitania populi]
MNRTLAGILLASAAMAMPTAAFSKTFVYCSEASPEGFDPSHYTAGTTFDASAHPIYNRLLDFRPGTTEIIPSLAERWEVSPDGKAYTFYLRKGVKWHSNETFTPTREFNADDVIFTFERQGDPKNPWHEYLPGTSYEYYHSMEFDTLIEAIERVDDHTVRFKLSRPEAPFLSTVALHFTSIMSKEYADQLQQLGRQPDFNTQPIGTGPFKFVAYQQDAAIRYQKNPDYWGEKAKVDDLLFAITPDAAVRLQKLRSGECHLMPYPAPADIEGIKADPQLKIEEEAGLNVGYLAYNTQMAPFDNPKVRKALNMAMNKQAIVDSVFLGGAQPAKNPIPPTMWSYNDRVVDDPYDPEAAKKILEEEGVRDLKMKLWAMSAQRPYMPNGRRTAEIMQADLAKVGVTAEIVSFEWGEYLAKSMEPGRDGAVILGWTGASGDPDNFLSVLLTCAGAGSGGANRAFWCNEEFSSLVAEAKVNADMGARTRAYEKAQEVFKKEAPWFTIAHSTHYVPMRKEVEGFVVSPLGDYTFETVDLAE